MEMEKLIAQIMAECEADGEPVTREEAEEMARLELKAKKEIKRYEQSDKPKKERKPREVKLDEDKIAIIDFLATCLSEWNFDFIVQNAQREIKIKFNNCDFSLTLTKHRPKK